MTTITQEFVRDNLPTRPDDANKGTMGTLLNISGSYSMAGACILSSLSALRSGVGLQKIALPQSIYPTVATNVYEAVFLPLKDSNSGTVDSSSLDFLLDNAKRADSVLLGCGLGLSDDTISFVRDFVGACTVPLLIDADGINALSMNIDVLKKSKADVVLTPHPKEMSRLCSLSVEEIQADRAGIASSFAKEYNAVVVLKGKDTVVTDGERVYVNPTGNSGMAKGGSGDVLSGIIASLMAQGVKNFEAACVGVYIHGLAGDLASAKLTKTAMLPRDIIEYLPHAFQAVEN